MSVWKSDEKLVIFASLISPSKIILFEKWYQAFATVFHYQMRHLVVCQNILCCALYFPLSSLCFIRWWNTASHAWYITWKSTNSTPSIGLNHSLENLRSFFRTLKVCKIFNQSQKVALLTCSDWVIIPKLQFVVLLHLVCLKKANTPKFLADIIFNLSLKF